MTAFATATTIVFDLGNVLIGWEPRALYRKLFDGREEDMEWFLGNVCTLAWNLEQDRGRRFAHAVEELVAVHPEPLHAAIRAYHERWPEMLTGEIGGSVELLRRLHAAGTPLYALTNWNQETFAHARARYAWLELFAGIVVSGEEGFVKPDAAIYRTLLERYQLQASACLFIDDSPGNVAGALAMGMQALHFRDPEQLRADLQQLGFEV
jgi:2-haloacid dehalogenase